MTIRLIPCLALVAMAATLRPIPAEAGTGTRTLGQAIGAAVGKKANTLNNAQAQRSAAPSQAPATHSRPHAEGTGNALPAGDALAGTDAQDCALNNGSAIRVSGGFRPYDGSACSK